MGVEPPYARPSVYASTRVLGCDGTNHYFFRRVHCGPRNVAAENFMRFCF